MFRHALALDERRVRFRPSPWGEPTTSSEETEGMVQENMSDIDTDPDFDVPNQFQWKLTTHDKWLYQPEGVVTDVKEVWFSGKHKDSGIFQRPERYHPGCHADVGGGAHFRIGPDGLEGSESLSNISLDWMIKECLHKDNNTGIIFNERRLEKMRTTFANEKNVGAALHDRLSNATTVSKSDPLAKQLYARLKGLLVWLGWWALETIPVLITQQTTSYGWERRRR